jgi:hypothetical protein
MAITTTGAARGDGAAQLRPPPPLVTGPQGLTPEFLTAHISRMHPGVEVASVKVLEALGIGGMVSTAGRIRLRLTYARNPAGLPERVVAKMIVEKRSISPWCMYETEVQVYARLLPAIQIEKPVCLAAVYEPDTENFMVIMEDLGQRRAKFTNVLLPPLSPDEVGVLLDCLATIHAQYWASPILEQEKAWLSSLTEGRQYDMFDQGFMVPVMEANCAESPYRRDFVTRCGRSPAELWELVKAVHRHHEATIPMTLCHGDTGAHNTFRLPDGLAGFVDWQLACRSAWPHDVHYLIVTALSVKDRREHERALIARYLRRLTDLGVSYKPDLDAAMADYSLSIIWGLTVGWFAVPSNMYGMEIISANIERIYAAACDHDIFNRAEQLL